MGTAVVAFGEIECNLLLLQKLKRLHKILRRILHELLLLQRKALLQLLHLQQLLFA